MITDSDLVFKNTILVNSPVFVLHCTFMLCFQNHWFTYNEKMSVESVTQAVSNLALAFGDDDADPGAMVTTF